MILDNEDRTVPSLKKGINMLLIENGLMMNFKADIFKKFFFDGSLNFCVHGLVSPRKNDSPIFDSLRNFLERGSARNYPTQPQ